MAVESDCLELNPCLDSDLAVEILNLKFCSWIHVQSLEFLNRKSHWVTPAIRLGSCLVFWLLLLITAFIIESPGLTLIADCLRVWVSISMGGPAELTNMSEPFVVSFLVAATL